MHDPAMTTAQFPSPGGRGEPAAQSGRIAGWRDFEDRFRAAMAMAAVHPDDITLMDTDFGHWPLGQRSVMEAFHQWVLASKSHRCHLLAARHDVLVREHPRWVAWRTTWAHRVHCEQAPDDLVPSLCPLMVLHDTVGLRVLEPLHGTGVWTRDQGRLGEWLSEIDAISQRSEPGLPATNLGL